MLNIVGSEDEDGYGLGCLIPPRDKGSKVVILPGEPHVFGATKEAVAAIAEFLAACCGLVAAE